MKFKNKNKGLTLIEAIVVMGIMMVIIFGTYSLYANVKNAQITQERNAVKKMMMMGANPHGLSPTISYTRIDQYAKEIIKENELAVKAGKANRLPEQEVYDEYNDTVIVSKPLTPIPQPAVEKPEPVIEQITENHYHFEALLTVSKYIGVSILAIFAFFSSIKSILLLKKYFTVRSATKNSKQILDKFDNEFEENKNYLAFIRKISDQVLVNSVLIDNRKNKETVLNLIVTNENLKDKLNFLESNFVKTMK